MIEGVIYLALAFVAGWFASHLWETASEPEFVEPNQKPPTTSQKPPEPFGHCLENDL